MDQILLWETTRARLTVMAWLFVNAGAQVQLVQVRHLLAAKLLLN
jgi:hypothetical protein